MRRSFNTILALAITCTIVLAQEQLDFAQQVKKIDGLVADKSYEPALAEINSLQNAITNTSFETEDSVQLYIASKLAIIYFAIDNCDSTIVNATKEVQLRTKIFGEAHPQKLTAQRNLGVYLLSCGITDSSKTVLLNCLNTHQTKLQRVDQLLLLTMDDLAYSYGKLGQIDSASHYYNQLIGLLEEHSSKNSFYYNVIDNYSALLSNNEKFQEASEFFDDLIEYKSKRNEYAQFLKDYYNIYIKIQNYTKALEVTEQLINICKTSDCNREGFSIQEFKINAARLSVLLNKWESGEKYYNEILQSFKGLAHEQILVIIEAAEVARIQNDRDKQFELLNKALQLHREHDLTDSVSFSQTVFRLGNTLTQLGKFQDADQIFSQYIGDLEGKAGSETEQLAKSYQALGNQRYLLQNFKDADFYFSKAQKLLIDNNLENTREGASILNSKGALSEALANYDAAEKSYQKALNILEKEKINAPTLKVALASNLAKIMMINRPKNDSILTLLSHAIAVQELSTGQMHPSYAILIGNRAKYFQESGNYKQAEADYLKSLNLLESTVGKAHPDYISNLSNIGLLYDDQDKDSEAEKSLLEAKTLYETYFSKDHPGYLLAINNLANFYTKSKNYGEAEVLLSELSKKQIAQIKASFSYLSESEKEKFVTEKRKFLQNFKRYIISRGNVDPSSLSKAIISDWYNLELATKGILLSSTKRVRDGIFQSGNIELISLFSEWTLLRKQVADISSLKATQIANSSQKVAELNSKIDAIEKELSRKSSDFTQSYGDNIVSIDDIRNSLQPNEAAVEMVRTDLDNDGVYAALVVTKNQMHPELIFVGSADRLEKKGFSVYKNSIAYSITDDVSFQTYWKPIHAYLKSNSIEKIYYAPDGVYHKVSLATIYNKDEKEFLLDSYQIVQVTSTKDVTQAMKLPSQMWEPRSSKYLLVGRPYYHLEGARQEATSIKTRSFSIEKLADLPGTEEEVNTVKDLLESEGVIYNQFLHAQSTEANVKANLNYDVIHIATHGFFLDKLSMKDGGAKLDPMLYSGLLFAGASDKGLKERTGEDGILTAFEIMNLGFGGNKMVILSACETGLGEISAGEGIYGLQRAFFVAGTETLIMSLWSVDDQATKDLMTTFYKNLLKKGDKRLAFLEAQKKIKKQYKHPIYWGAFVMIGI